MVGGVSLVGNECLWRDSWISSHLSVVLVIVLRYKQGDDGCSQPTWIGRDEFACLQCTCNIEIVPDLVDGMAPTPNSRIASMALS